MKSTERILALRNARKIIRNRDKKLATLKRRLEMLTSQSGVELGSDMENEMFDIINTHHPEIESLPMSDFRRVFWCQQVLLYN